MRTFLAVPISVTDELRLMRQQLGKLRPPLKMIAVDQLHVTSVFLGETDESLIPRFAEIVDQVASSNETETVTLRGLGAFSKVTRPTVVWAGFDNASLLIRLADQLSACCESLGFSREARPYQPHLTLARVKAQPTRDLVDLIDEHSVTELGSVTIESLTLFRSDLEPSGPTYTPIVSRSLM